MLPSQYGLALITCLLAILDILSSLHMPLLSILIYLILKSTKVVFAYFIHTQNQLSPPSVSWLYIRKYIFWKSSPCSLDVLSPPLLTAAVFQDNELNLHTYFVDS